MIIGQTVFAGTFYSPWFPRQGDAAVFSGEVIARLSPGTLTAFIQTKKMDETDTGAAATTNGTIAWAGGTGVKATTDGSVTAPATGMKELVRFQYVVTGTGWVHFRILPPAWQQN